MMLRPIYDQWIAEMKACGCDGIISLFDDYKNGDYSNAAPTPSTKNEHTKTAVSIQKNGWPAVGIGGPSSPLNQDGEIIALSN